MVIIGIKRVENEGKQRVALQRPAIATSDLRRPDKYFILGFAESSFPH